MEGFSQKVRDFIETGRNFIFDVLSKRKAKSYKNHQLSYKNAILI
jgi:hypothetical protein